MSDDSGAVLDYHQRTKHQLNGYAKGPASLDWDDQPSPFRRFDGCETVALPQPGAELDCRYADLDRPATIPAQPLTLANVGLLLELSFGLSAWKQFGPDRWALRCNPSSGNLHPTEAICFAPIRDYWRPAFTTTSATTTIWNGVAGSMLRICRRACMLACRPSTGGKLGNTANAPSVTASTTSAMPWQR
ncbi:hypothetical protein [Methylomonas koyamae]|uniref:hypothetical protein n=1 Tax=Methylomonas koyamae TaxID=702114 RepID=UPI000B0E118F|nr:hypothetical protein [Methylomonas koyamae]